MASGLPLGFAMEPAAHWIGSPSNQFWQQSSEAISTTSEAGEQLGDTRQRAPPIGKHPPDGAPGYGHMMASSVGPPIILELQVHPETSYAETVDGVFIAYQVLGEGPYTIVLIQSAYISNVELAWEWPFIADQYRRLAVVGRVVVFDRRGAGLSDKVSG